ncbi:MAG: type II secretion system protein N [Myxococcota bacterium]|jgi:type II secretion system protein N
MANSESFLTAPLPKPLLRIGVPVAAICLTSFFIVLGFPYHHLANSMAASVGENIGVEIETSDASLTMGTDGVGFRFDGVTIETTSGAVYHLDTARLGPAWALSWFTAVPTLFATLHSPYGDVAGTYRTGDDSHWAGTVTDLALDDLEFVKRALPIGLTGLLTSTVDIGYEEGVLVGPGSILLKDGVISHPSAPREVPYSSITSAFVFGGDEMLTVDSFTMDSSELKLNGSGTVGNAETLQQSQLDLSIALTDVAPLYRGVAQAMGVKVDPQGAADVKISGTVAVPEFR